MTMITTTKQRIKQHIREYSIAVEFSDSSCHKRFTEYPILTRVVKKQNLLFLHETVFVNFPRF